MEKGELARTVRHCAGLAASPLAWVMFAGGLFVFGLVMHLPKGRRLQKFWHAAEMREMRRKLRVYRQKHMGLV